MPKMTLACKTADLLALAIHALNHVTSPGQHALLSADERTSTLQHLGAAVQAAAKLAEVAHAEVLGGNRPDTEAREVGREAAVVETLRMKTEIENIAETGRLHAEREKLKAEAEKVGRETERAVAETERLKALAMAARSEKMRIDAETERTKAETERVKVEADGVGGKDLWSSARATPRTPFEEGTGGLKTGSEKVGDGAERAVAETERLKAEAVRVRSEKMKIDAEAARVKAEAERMRRQKERADKEAESPAMVLQVLGLRHPRVLEMQREAYYWNFANHEEDYTIWGWAWYKDREAPLLIGGDNDKEISLNLPASVLVGDNKFKLHSGLFGIYGEEYDAIRDSYEGVTLVGPKKKGGKRETIQIVF